MPPPRSIPKAELIGTFMETLAFGASSPSPFVHGWLKRLPIPFSKRYLFGHFRADDDRPLPTLQGGEACGVPRRHLSPHLGMRGAGQSFPPFLEDVLNNSSVIFKHWVVDMIREIDAFTGHMDEVDAPLKFYANVAAPTTIWKTAAYAAATHISDLFIVSSPIVGYAPRTVLDPHTDRFTAPSLSMARAYL
jgi:hypothetical protein